MKKIIKGVFSLDCFTKKELVKLIDRINQKTLFGEFYDNKKKDSMIYISESTHIVKSFNIFENDIEVICEPLGNTFAKNFFIAFRDYDFKVVPRFSENGEFLTFDIEPFKSHEKTLSIAIEKIRPDGVIEENKSFDFKFEDKSIKKFKNRLFLTIGDFKYIINDKGEILDKI